MGAREDNMTHTPPIAMKKRVSVRVGPRSIIAGDVLAFRNQRWLIASNEYPAATVARPENKKYCEPAGTLLKKVKSHNGTRWFETSTWTYMLLELGKQYTVYRTPS